MQKNDMQNDIPQQQSNAASDAPLSLIPSERQTALLPHAENPQQVLTGTFRLNRREVTALRKINGFAALLAVLEEGGKFATNTFEFEIVAQHAPTTVKRPRKIRRVGRYLQVNLQLSAELLLPKAGAT